MADIEIPLTRDVIREPPREFFPSFLEWIPDGNAEQIIKRGSLSGGGATLYTVPENFTLFITSAWVSAAETSNVTSHGQAFLSISGVAPIIGVIVDHVTGQHGGNFSMSSTFPMPLRVDSGKTVFSETSSIANPDGSAGFTGFLLPKKISIR